VGVTLIDILPWGFPFSSCKAAKYEVIGCLDDSQSPVLLVTAIMEVVSVPAMSVRIINPLESSLRILVPNKFHDHLPMGGGQKGLRVSEIFFRIISDRNARLSFHCHNRKTSLRFYCHNWNTRLRLNNHLFLGISKICISLGKLLLNLLELLV
jgi:hypothetical protein